MKLANTTGSDIVPEQRFAIHIRKLLVRFW